MKDKQAIIDMVRQKEKMDARKELKKLEKAFNEDQEKEKTYKERLVNNQQDLFKQIEER